MLFRSSSDWDVFGSNNEIYTIDFWMQNRTTVTAQALVGQEEDNDNYWFFSSFIFGAGNGLVLQLEDENDIKLTIDSYAQTGTWILDELEHHIMLYVEGTGATKVIGIYLDGDQVAYGTLAGNYTFDGSGLGASLVLGTCNGGQNNGYIDEFRVQHSNYFNADPQADYSDTIELPTEAYSEVPGSSITNATLYNATIYGQ